MLDGFPKTSKQCYLCKARWSAILRLFQAQHLQHFYMYVRNNIVERGLLWQQFVEHEGKRAERLARDGTDPVFDVEEFLAARGYHFAGVPRRRVIGRPSATEPCRRRRAIGSATRVLWLLAFGRSSGVPVAEMRAIACRARAGL